MAAFFASLAPTPHRPIAREARYGMRRIGSKLGSVIAPLCRNAGIVRAELVLDWAVIAGPVYGAETRPLRITGARPNRCLHVGASRSMAALMVYEVPALLERIHRYFGEAIVDTIKFEDDHYRADAPVLAQPKPKPVNPEVIMAIWDSIQYSPLAKALENLVGCLEK